MRDEPMRRLKVMIALLAACLSWAVSAAPPAPDFTVERVVLLMRHGVRPPTKSPPLPQAIAADAWPAWPVAPGHLTPHGAAAVGLLGGWDRTRYRSLLPANACPRAGAIAIVSDSDERTIRTGEAYAEGVAPGCGIANAHRPQDVADPLFSPIDEAGVPYDAALARQAVVAALPQGGVAALDANATSLLRKLDRIYRCCAPPACAAGAGGCSLETLGSDLSAAVPGKRPKLTGALDIGSTAAQILLLEYTEGMPMREVGWGRASSADITALSELHALEFAVLARPRYLAAANIAPIVRRMLTALTDADPKAPSITLLMGHDTNVASLGGLLDLHWQVPGLARDDPPPGGAIGFELLHDRAGGRFVRAVFRAQTLDQIRTLAPLGGDGDPYMAVVPIPGCRSEPCPLRAFRELIEQRLSHIISSSSE